VGYVEEPVAEDTRFYRPGKLIDASVDDTSDENQCGTISQDEIGK